MDPRIGYLELGDADQKPITLRLGRQELNFGEQRLLGSDSRVLPLKNEFHPKISDAPVSQFAGG